MPRRSTHRVIRYFSAILPCRYPRHITCVGKRQPYSIHTAAGTRDICLYPRVQVIILRSRFEDSRAQDWPHTEKGVRSCATLALPCVAQDYERAASVSSKWAHAVPCLWYRCLVGNGRGQEREMRHRERFAAEKRRKDVQQLQVNT